jgi:TM2 domain-containing membrane protein YozV
MNKPSHCPQCSQALQHSDVTCPQCGTGIASACKGQKSAVITLLLCLFLGSLGAHRFYVGKMKTGLLMLITAGGLGIWTLVDLITIACCRFKDVDGCTLIFTQVQDSRYKKILLIALSAIAGIVIYIACLFTLMCYLTNPMTQVVNNQLNALRAGDMAMAYSYMADQSETSVSFDDFKNYVDTHPAMSNSTDTTFNERKVENGQAYLKGELSTRDGNRYPVEYMLVERGENWKIIGLRVGPVEPADSNASDDASMQTYTDAGNTYTVEYPGNWTRESSGKSSVLFSGKQGTPSYATAVTIQTVSTEGTAPKDNPVKMVMDELKNQIHAQTTNAKFIDSGTIQLPSNKEIHGEYLVATYNYKGQDMKKMQYVLLSKDGKTLYSWSYTSPKEQFDGDLPIAKSMFESWDIK